MNGYAITGVEAREVLDCRGLPTVEVDVELDGVFQGRVGVPSGRSTGTYEAFELRDGGPRFGGFGVTQAVGNVLGEIADEILGEEYTSQRAFDQALIALDGTPNKERLGANALLGVSVAASRAAAAAQGLPYYLALNPNANRLPAPLVNLINGGKHASNDLDFQEIIVIPVGADSILHALQISTEINLVLAELLLAHFGKAALNTGDEGGYAPAISQPEEALEFLRSATEKAGYADLCTYGLDCAATHLYDSATGRYTIAGKEYASDELVDYYEGLFEAYGIVTVEDPFHEDDFEAFVELGRRCDVQIVGDDLFVTNTERLAKGVSMGAANALLWKMNQVGTLTEALDAAEYAFRSGYGVVVSERSGETEDSAIADLVVALNAGQIKTGAPVRGERTSKYNQLIRIEQQLGGTATYGPGPEVAARLGARVAA